jgi:hypothetical protein
MCFGERVIQGKLGVECEKLPKPKVAKKILAINF